MSLTLTTQSALGRNLQRLSLLRAILIVVAGISVTLAHVVFHTPLLFDGWIVSALGLLTLVNIYTVWRLRKPEPVSESEIFWHLVFDVLILTIVFYRTGGATNPFVFYFLVPITIASATLHRHFSVLLTGLTLAAYTVLLFFYEPFHLLSVQLNLMPVDGMPMHHDHHAHQLSDAFNSHTFGMWLNFLLSAGLITWFVTRMSGALREQDNQIADQRERLLQKEQIVAIGALAAGAAHELGTPLSTMTVLVQDMDERLPSGHDLKPDMAILSGQLKQCRTILSGLRQQAMNPNQTPSLTLKEYGESLEQKMSILHPSRVFTWRILHGIDEVIAPELMVQQVVVNLLNNAAEASKAQVMWQMSIRHQAFILEISDDGEGIDPTIAERLGKPYVSSKPNGMGIGFFLSHATVNQWGGSLRLESRPDGGTKTELILPLNAMRAEV